MWLWQRPPPWLWPLASDLQWGWRVSCHSPHCTRTAESWDRHGVPALSRSGDYIDGPHAGWFLYKEKGSTYELIAYCPQHSGPASKWRYEHRLWVESYRKEAAEVRESMMSKLSRSLLPEVFFAALQGHIKKEMVDWKPSHPKPIPRGGSDVLESVGL